MTGQHARVGSDGGRELDVEAAQRRGSRLEVPFSGVLWLCCVRFCAAHVLLVPILWIACVSRSHAEPAQAEACVHAPEAGRQDGCDDS